MAAAFKIDIKTRFIPADRKVFLLFPGNNYRYYKSMVDESVVYLDLPGFPMPKDLNVSKLEDIEERIAVSEAIVKWHRKDKPADNLPPRSVNELTSFRRHKRRQFMTGVTRGFFSTIREGDVVIVPPRDFEDDVMIGEFVDDGTVATMVAAPFHFGEKIPARKVKWIAREKRIKASLPVWGARSFRSR